MQRKNTVGNDPRLLAEWDQEKNGVSPDGISLWSTQRYFWRCSVCGHQWQTSVYSRVSGNTSCPVCARQRSSAHKIKTHAQRNNLAVNCPDIAKEWHPTKNEDKKPEDFAVHSNKKVWWLCSCCGNEWAATINHRTTENTGCPVCSKRRSSSQKIKTHAQRNNLAVNCPDIAKEWHPIKNGDKKPEDFAVHSNKKVWWLCGFCGNEWETTITHRTAGEGCPACSKASTSRPEQIVFFYVAQAFPDAVNRYREKYEFDIYIPSIRTAIEYDGYVYHRSSKSLYKDNVKDRYCLDNGIRMIRFRAPQLTDTENAVRITCEDYHLSEGIRALFDILACACPDVDIDRDRITILEHFRQVRIENSIAQRFPDIAREWYAEKNGRVLPTAVPAMSNVKFWWKCHVCGYVWQDTPNHRCGRSSNCPFCIGKAVVAGKNDLATRYPALAAEWDYERNQPLLPSQVAVQSNKRVWWKCSEHNHTWIASISERTRKGRNTNCPYCGNKKVLPGFNDLATTHPEFAAEWSDKNTCSPTQVTKGSSKLIWWKCRLCGHEWQAVVYSRKNCNCPLCNKKKHR
ncbi:MAG: zinc-ribbon domain-containing protein [Clostridia bacterium]|nr:zinc-ribbon domain-containing protein [Clostridia bacterium]